MSGHEFGDAYGSSVNARMASHVGEGPHEPVDDLDRTGVKGESPVPGAQWDEIHRRWERWDDDAQAWVVVGDDAGAGVAPLHENPFTAILARELLHADALEGDQPAPVPDVGRAPAPKDAPPGAQWNEVAERWERWDETSEAWVDAGP